MPSNDEGKSSLRDAIRKRQSEVQAETPEETPGAEQPKSETGLLNTPIVMKGAGLKDTANFCRQLTTLLNVGIPLQRCLEILSKRTQHPRMREVIGNLHKRIDEGSNFSDALAAHPDVFSPLVVNVARIGELGGILESSMSRLAEILENKLEIRRRVFSASLYPAVVVLVMIAVISVVLMVAVPQFKEMLTKTNAPIPDISAWLFWLSDFYIVYWPILLVALIALILFFWLFPKTQAGKHVMETIGYSLPTVRRMPIHINIARATRSIGSLMAAGIPLLEAIKVTANSSEGHKMRKALLRVHESLETGGRFETPLRDEPGVFPPITVDMIAVGEEAGALDTMLLSIADNSDAEVDLFLSTLQSILEPLLLLFMGVVVLLVALALFLPYFSMIGAQPY